ncbi:CHRD domain-containing protein [Massilia sp. YMA4]|uniref:CHRD domain-containing protein n=1 Tax=Massilia sp. YMA4 TaxID=1593482 RepID=UPI000DD171F6|nr:CHRD domain-containing protein [Massilia sp. YMA4]AXA90089.1 PEP-CTERM sorting domain-containing protein [Massilia sp. YMA4]
MLTTLPKALTTLALVSTALTAGATVQIAPSHVYTAQLSGASEDPPNGSTATGSARIGFDIGTHTLTIDVTFSGLLGDSTNAHLHCCTALPGAGTAGPATSTPTLSGFPSGVRSGTYHHVFDTSLASTWNNGFINSHGGIAGAEQALLAALDNGQAYFNIHSSFAPGGEIRGFLQPVPEPGELAMLAVGLPFVLVLARRRRG